MTAPPETLPAEAPVARAARRLQEEDIGSVMVTADGTPDGALEGVVTESDIVSVVARRASVSQPVESVMSPDPVALAPDASVDRVGDVVCEQGVRHFPVVDGAVVGVITARDVACLLPTYRLEPDGPGEGGVS